MNYWLVKSEPNVYSIDDLARDKTTYWEGVRNYQARNFLRDKLQKGDQVLFYHSNAEPPGIVGTATVSKSGYPDQEAFNSKSKYFDPKSKKDTPTWYGVDLKFGKKYKSLISLEALRAVKGLEKMPLLQRGQRLSVQPVSKSEWNLINKMA